MKKNIRKNLKNLSILLLSVMLITSCSNQIHHDKINQAKNKKMFITILTKHLKAVTNRDLESLLSTMSPTGEMQLIVPQTEVLTSVDAFMNYHKEWFAAPNWTFETKILNTKVFDDFGMAIVEIIYREPQRNGVPYFNRMIVSYDLEKIDNNWYIIKDHASSVQKSTD